MLSDIELRIRGYHLRVIKDPQRRNRLARVLYGLRHNINRERNRAYALSGMVEYSQGMAEGWRRAVTAMEEGWL